MFQYSGKRVAGFIVAQSVLYKGDTHSWKYPSSGPSEQTRMSGGSVYANGSILYSMGDYSRIMTPGETWVDQYDETFDDYIASVPEGMSLISTMTVVSPYATRYCILPAVNTDKWNSDIYNLQPGDILSEPTDTCIFVLSGEITINDSVMKSISYRLLPGNDILTSTGVSKVLISRISG
jgi:hypothetical protein